MHLVCKKCMHEWEYTGTKHRTSCSKCKTSITLQQQQEPEPEPAHRVIRISMSHNKMIELGEWMIKFVNREGLDKNYAIEYDYVDRALYVDVTEPEENEKELMVKD